MDDASLEAALLQAHADHNHDVLVALYTAAADGKEADGDVDAACFFMTQAFVFALECGAPDAHDLNNRLVAYGRAHPITGPIDG